MFRWGQRRPQVTGGTEPLSSALKTQTQKQHDEAEAHPLHAVLFGSSGADAAREAYGRLLGQHLLIQRAFVPLLRRAAAESPWGGVVRGHHFHLAAIEQDCAALGVNGEAIRPLPATARFGDVLERLAAGSGAGLLGVFYVFEGSTNGGTIIAMRVRELLRFEGDTGTRFINPHGPQVRPRWVQWKQDVDAMEIGDADRNAAIAGAADAFRLSHAVLTDVHSAMTATAVARPQVVVRPLNAAAKAS